MKTNEELIEEAVQATYDLSTNILLKAGPPDLQFNPDTFLLASSQIFASLCLARAIEEMCDD